ncbi:MAG: hypothetical protein Q7S27_03755 [Nanoarchaeota archaeon]|nr:hypothetical protein [Nanoarchaeota archaeon]
MEKTINLEDVYRELKKIEEAMITKKELKKILTTLEILSNEDTMSQINRSEEDILKGHVKEVDSVRDI